MKNVKLRAHLFHYCNVLLHLLKLKYFLKLLLLGMSSLIVKVLTENIIPFE